ncbi:DNA-binding protein [Paenibacillus barcinonensis]|uniref:DNA-binding protein n=1 Tax=Paenibacillus barcinonensis TaxID=198119 RepID=A0A2V4W2D4_PAEBA|nr:DNA-binding protein [Paenibacillus barcinonensis]PYE48591.1 hypothetical protein DFQ00_108183 [Paenibacillus barcinonensis]QKS58716.1 DNA-binding protein [Paenibacillus barcinonensis]
MFKDTKLIIPSIIIGVSLILSSLINGYFESKQKFDNPQTLQTQENSTLLTKEEAAKYFQISISELDDIINKDIDRKQNMAIFDTYQFIPYANLNGKLIFTKTNLDKWIDYNTGKKE